MKLTWEGIRAAFETVKALGTGAVELENANAKADAATRINELGNRNLALAEENKALKEKLENQSSLERDTKGYYVEKSTGRKVCGLCWEKHKQLRTLLEDRKNGPAAAMVGGGMRSGYGSWTELLKCPDCKTEYGHERKSKSF